MSYKIFIVDDHPIMRRGYVALINGEADLTVCGEASSAQEALDLIPGAKPDLVVADISLEGMSGIELVKRLQARHPDVQALVVSMHDESLYAERALHAGAQGYVMKSEVDSVIIKAIRRILNGGFYLSDSMSQRILLQYTGRRQDENTSPLERLTDRELEVYEHLGRGLSTRQVAESMHISPKTVETYRGRIKSKLAIDTTAELIQRATLWVQGERAGQAG